ncbi:PREDICTED: uncharacterized protein LOC109116598 [Tarenaya hassleriana]|uniref:uncharacterized protein LOC109116598 n=1 Tax=Tarenaya hassleriana TaxID=28532 RepID=UPI0008FD565E|nr:PREDICTED: uncharacterized protein LOC109116598 [Tarenaya hassleriana]
MEGRAHTYIQNNKLIKDKKIYTYIYKYIVASVDISIYLLPQAPFLLHQAAMSGRRSLMHFEQLSLPSFQVVVINADVGCRRCQHRVSQIVSKMTGIKEYMVDVRSKQVIARGDFREHDSMPKIAKGASNPIKLLLASMLAICLCGINSFSNH